MMSEGRILIGVDGGGSSARAALLRPGGEGRVDLRGGPANVSDFVPAMAGLKDLLVRLMVEAGLTPDDGPRITAHLGLAGVLRTGLAGRVAADLPFGRITVSGDQPTMIAGALGAEDGAVAAIGTGSFVGRQDGGAISCLGGWGFALGDQASGAWLGRRLLAETLLYMDGIVPATPLLAETARRFGGGAEITAFGLASRPADYARLAPAVVEAAGAGDAFAQALFRDGAAYIEGALEALGHPADAPLCLSGGLGPSYAPYLSPGRAAHLVAPKGTALDGALILAARAAEGAP